jgi:23S rRNA pseudouridine2605 synthase
MVAADEPLAGHRLMRLAKHLAHAGIASRRAAEAMIAAGRVRVDGEIVRDPARDVDERSRVSVDDRAVGGAEARVTYMLHKPVGVVSTARDTHGRTTVLDLVPVAGVRLYPVGRLDADSGGLILLSNDGELAARLTHPRHEVPKTYRAHVGGAAIGPAALRRLREGVELDDGPTAPARVRLLSAHELELTIHEGRNRQVRRMCAAVGHPVRKLCRERFGPIALGGLAEGQHRRLRERELELLRSL